MRRDERFGKRKRQPQIAGSEEDIALARSILPEPLCAREGCRHKRSWHPKWVWKDDNGNVFAHGGRGTQLPKNCTAAVNLDGDRIGKCSCPQYVSPLESGETVQADAGKPVVYGVEVEEDPEEGDREEEEVCGGDDRAVLVEGPDE